MLNSQAHFSRKDVSNNNVGNRSSPSKKLDLRTLTNYNIQKIDFKSFPLINPADLTELDLAAIQQLDLSSPNDIGMSFADYLAKSLAQIQQNPDTTSNRFAEALSEWLIEHHSSDFSAKAKRNKKTDLNRSVSLTSRESSGEQYPAQQRFKRQDVNKTFFKRSSVFLTLRERYPANRSKNSADINNTEGSQSSPGKELDLATFTNYDIGMIDFENIPLINLNDLTERDLFAIQKLDLSILNTKGKSFAKYLVESLEQSPNKDLNGCAQTLSKILSKYQSSVSSVKANPLAEAFSQRSKVFVDINNLIDADFGQMDFDSLPLLTPNNIRFDFHAVRLAQRGKFKKLDLDQIDRNGVSLRNYLEKSFTAFYNVKQDLVAEEDEGFVEGPEALTGREVSSNSPAIDNVKTFFTPTMLRLVAYTGMSGFVRELSAKWKETNKQGFLNELGSLCPQKSRELLGQLANVTDKTSPISDEDTPQEQLQKQISRGLLRQLEKEMDRTLQIAKAAGKPMINDGSSQEETGSGEGMTMLELQNVTPKLDMGVQDLNMTLPANPQSQSASPSDAQPPTSSFDPSNPFAGIDFSFNVVTSIFLFAFGNGSDMKGIIDLDAEAQDKANNDVEGELQKLNDLNDAAKDITDDPTGLKTMDWHSVYTNPDGTLGTTTTQMSVADGLKQFYSINLSTQGAASDQRQTNTLLINSQKDVENSKLNQYQQKANAVYSASNDHMQALISMLTQYIELFKTLIQNTGV